MKLHKSLWVIISLVAFSGCSDDLSPVEVTQTRALTRYDADANLHVVMPLAWRRVPSTKFRNYNCKFNETGEVYISIASGDVKSNAERWLKQFNDNSSLDLSKLEKFDLMGTQGFIVEANGTYSGMRGLKKENAALLGLLVETRGNLITVKMIAEKNEVEAQRANFKSFCKSIEWR